MCLLCTSRLQHAAIHLFRTKHLVLLRLWQIRQLALPSKSTCIPCMLMLQHQKALALTCMLQLVLSCKLMFCMRLMWACKLQLLLLLLLLLKHSLLLLLVLLLLLLLKSSCWHLTGLLIVLTCATTRLFRVPYIFIIWQIMKPVLLLPPVKRIQRIAWGCSEGLLHTAFLPQCPLSALTDAGRSGLSTVVTPLVQRLQSS